MKIVRMWLLFLLMILVTGFTGQRDRVVKAGTAPCPVISASNVTRLAPVQRLPDQKSVKALQFSPDGKRLTIIAGYAFAAVAQQWELATAHKRSQASLSPSDNPVYLISPDGRFVAQGTALANGVMQTPARLFDMTTGRAIFVSQFDGFPVFFAMDQKTAVFLDAAENSVYTFRWDTLHVQRLFTLGGSTASDKIVIRISNDLRWVVTEAINMDYHVIGPLELWDTPTMRARPDIYQDRTEKPGPNFYEIGEFSPDSQYLVLAGITATHLIDLRQGKQTAEWNLSAAQILMSPDSRYGVLSGNYVAPDARESIIDLATGAVVTTPPNTAQPMQFSPDSRTLLLSDAKTVRLWDMQKLAERIVLPVNVLASVGAYGWSNMLTADGSLYGYAPVDGTAPMTWWDTQTGQMVATYAMQWPSAISPDGTLIAAGGGSDEVVIWGVSPCQLQP